MAKAKFERTKPHVNVGRVFGLTAGVVTIMVAIGLLWYTQASSTTPEEDLPLAAIGTPVSEEDLFLVAIGTPLPTDDSFSWKLVSGEVNWEDYTGGCVGVIPQLSIRIVLKDQRTGLEYAIQMVVSNIGLSDEEWVYDMPDDDLDIYITNGPGVQDDGQAVPIGRIPPIDIWEHFSVELFITLPEPPPICTPTPTPDSSSGGAAGSSGPSATATQASSSSKPKPTSDSGSNSKPKPTATKGR